MTTRIRYLISCAAAPTRTIEVGIGKAQAAGWDVCLILTPSARRWRRDDLDGLRDLTGLVALDHDDPLSGVDQLVERPEQLLHVGGCRC